MLTSPCAIHLALFTFAFLSSCAQSFRFLALTNRSLVHVHYINIIIAKAAAARANSDLSNSTTFWLLHAHFPQRRSPSPTVKRPDKWTGRFLDFIQK